MTIAAWIHSLQKFDPALGVLVRIAGNGPSQDLLFIAEKPCFSVDAGCTDTDMLCVDMVHGDEGIDEVPALGPPDHYQANLEEVKSRLAGKDARIGVLGSQLRMLGAVAKSAARLQQRDISLDQTLGEREHIDKEAKKANELARKERLKTKGQSTK